jgi:hypothetical protein
MIRPAVKLWDEQVELANKTARRFVRVAGG